jgi:hypothetical protein
MSAFFRNIVIGFLAIGVSSGAVLSIPPANRHIDKIETHVTHQIEAGDYVRTSTLDLTVETVKVFRYRTREVNGVTIPTGIRVMWKAKLKGTQTLDTQNPVYPPADEISATWSWDEQKVFEPDTRNPYLDCFNAIVDNFPESVPPELTSPLDGCVPEPKSLLLGVLGMSLLLVRTKQ